jgi:hypothetical protein
MSARSVTQDKDCKEHRLNAMQTALLRGWSMNMSFSSVAQARRLGFDYSTAEFDRFNAITKNVPPVARAFWFFGFIVSYFALSMPVIVGCALYLNSQLVSLAAIIVAVFLIYPAAAAISSYATDLAFQLAPLQQPSEDFELYQKVEWQLICIAILAVIAATIIAILNL